MQNSKYHRRALQNIKAAEEDKEDFVEKEVKIARTPYELQRLRLEKLLANPNKPVGIPNPKKQGKAPPPPPEFIRNVVGSSAGAGSGEYHIYRNLRKREYIRQEFIEKLNKTEALDKQYADKVEAHKLHYAEKSRKKREKRKRLKEKLKEKGKKGKLEQDPNESKPSRDSESDEDDEDDDEEVDEAAIAAHLAKYGLSDDSSTAMPNGDDDSSAALPTGDDSLAALSTGDDDSSATLPTGDDSLAALSAGDDSSATLPTGDDSLAALSAGDDDSSVAGPSQNPTVVDDVF